MTKEELSKLSVEELRAKIRNVHGLRYYTLRKSIHDFLIAERGRASKLADTLGISRQTVSRCLVSKGWEWQKIEGSTAVALFAWWFALTMPKELSKAFIEWQSLYYVPRRVTPQADKTPPQVVTPQADNPPDSLSADPRTKEGGVS